jgi:hypothetical protein
MIIIKDPILEPYYIGKDKHNYTVFEIVPTTLNGKKGRRKKDDVIELDPNGKTYEKSIGYYSTLGHAIEAISRQKMTKCDSYTSLKEYMDELKSINQETQNLINKLNTCQN